MSLNTIHNQTIALAGIAQAVFLVQQIAKTGSTDQDAMEALGSLGYDTSTILHALKNLPKDLTSTEERVAAALRSL